MYRAAGEAAQGGKGRGMIDKQIPCTRDCPERSPTCKCTCEKWAAWDAIKRERYAKRKKLLESNPIGPAKAANAKRKYMDAMRGRNR